MMHASPRIVVSALWRRSSDRFYRTLSRHSVLTSFRSSSCYSGLPLCQPIDQRERDNDSRRLGALPSLQLPHFRSFSATTKTSDRKSSTATTTSKIKHDEEHKDQSSLGERARSRAINARKVAGKAGRAAGKAGRKGAKQGMSIMKQYGPVFVPTYICVYFTTLASLFAGVDSGLLDPVNLMSMVSSNADETQTTVEVVVKYLEHYEWTKDYAPWIESNPHFANLAVAWIAVKFTEPVRLAVAMAITPRIARYFGFVEVQEEHIEDTAEIETDEKETQTTDEVEESTKKR